MQIRTISRRKFIRAAGVTLGAAALTVTVPGCAPSQAEKAPVETPSYTYGSEASQDPRVLVLYATRTGSTVGVAAAIGETLAGRGFQVDVKPYLDNPDPQGYQAYLLGSAINGGQWLPEAVEYVKKHQEALNQAPAALFCVHIMNLGEDESSRKNRLAYLDDIRALLTPTDEAYFAGMGMNPEEQSGLIRWAYRTFNMGPEGDCRDWGKINGWAEAVEL